MRSKGINAYQQQEKASVEVARPEQLVATLFTKLMDALTKARRFIEVKDIPKKAGRINLAIDILTVLEQSLDHEKGGELANNLQALYQYCMKRLMHAHAGNDITALDEVAQLMREVQEGWEAMISSKTEGNPVGTASVADG